jgi:uncharacterized protein YlxP (DUF503 family)
LQCGSQLCVLFSQFSISLFKVKNLKDTRKILKEITTDSIAGGQKFRLLVVVVGDNQGKRENF